MYGRFIVKGLKELSFGRLRHDLKTTLNTFPGKKKCYLKCISVWRCTIEGFYLKIIVVGGRSVDPRDGHPLRRRAQSCESRFQLGQGVVYIVVNYRHIEIVTVRTA